MAKQPLGFSEFTYKVLVFYLNQMDPMILILPNKQTQHIPYITIGLAQTSQPSPTPFLILKPGSNLALTNTLHLTLSFYPVTCHNLQHPTLHHHPYPPPLHPTLPFHHYPPNPHLCHKLSEVRLPQLQNTHFPPKPNMRPGSN